MAVLMLVLAAGCSSGDSGFKAIDGSQVKVSKAELGSYCDAVLDVTATIGSDSSTVRAALIADADKLDALATSLKDATAAGKVRHVRDAMLAFSEIGNAADPSAAADKIVAAFDVMPPCGDFKSSP